MGLLTGGFAAWAYCGGPFHQLSHTFGLWIASVALLSARQTRSRAMIVSFLTLFVAVFAFFHGKKIMYGIKYPGMPYSVNAFQLLEWGILAAIAGALLGAIFAGIGNPGRGGAVSTASAIGLLAADAYRRVSNYHSQTAMLVGFAAAAIVAALLVAVRTPRQLLGVGVWSLPAAVLGYGLVSAPDALEQLLLTGSP